MSEDSESNSTSSRNKSDSEGGLLRMHWAGGEIWTFKLTLDDANTTKEGAIPISVVRALFESSGMSVTLEELIKFRNPPGCAEIVRLMRHNRRLKEEAALEAAMASETTPAEKRTDDDNAGGVASSSAGQSEHVVTDALPAARRIWSHPAMWISLSKKSHCIIGYQGLTGQNRYSPTYSYSISPSATTSCRSKLSSHSGRLKG